MKERLIEFLRNENKSSAQLAEEIGVQPSGISHIISGRNNPSLDFVLKMLNKYPFLSSDWLLFGKGSMYKEPKMRNLFDFDQENAGEKTNIPDDRQKYNRNIEASDHLRIKPEGISVDPENIELPNVVKIVWFYDNNSFDEYYPRK